MRTDQLDECARLIKEGKEVIYIKTRRTKHFQLEMEKRGVVFPEPIVGPQRGYDGSNPSNWLPEIEDETLPAGYKYWSEEDKAKYQERVKEFIKAMMPKDLPNIGRPFILSSDIDNEGGHRFRDLFLDSGK